MARQWRAWTVAGSFSLALAAAPAEARQDVPPSDVPPAEAAAPAEAEETPVRARKPKEGDGLPRTFGPVAPVIPAPSVGAAAAVAVPAGPTVVGDYRVGHVHEPALAHLFWYSAYNPHLDILHQPFRQVAYGGAHARYYAGYRNVYAPNWHEFYVPRYYAPACYGYDPYGPSYYGYGQTRSSYYGPGYYGPRSAAQVESPVPPAPPSDYHRSGFRYTGEQGIYSPYGVGSSAYFGAYGSAGY